MEFALGVLHWSPQTFWQSTMLELMAANDGVVKSYNTPEDDKMERADFELLKAAVKAKEKTRKL